MHPPVPTGYALGVNYPKLNNAEDFGVSPAGHLGLSLAASREVVERDFEAIRESGATVTLTSMNKLAGTLHEFGGSDGTRTRGLMRDRQGVLTS
jgi:hypothetical protein